MARKRRAVTLTQLVALDKAMEALTDAQQQARIGGAKNSVRYLSRARKSLQGAINHARGTWQQYIAQLVDERMED